MTTPRPIFSPLLGILCFTFLAFSHPYQAKAEGLCDSLTVSGVEIIDGNLQITVYNSSGQTIIYPYFTTTLDENPYLIMEDTFIVLSLLSIPGDFNDGYTTAFYSGTYAAPETVPLNTTFTGNLIIGDPNDSTFSCTLPFTFQYGTMPTSILDNKLFTEQVYPNPSAQVATLTLPQPNTAVQIFDLQGKLIQEFIAIDTQTPLYMQTSGCYLIRMTTANQITTAKWVVR